MAIVNIAIPMISGNACMISKALIRFLLALSSLLHAHTTIRMIPPIPHVNILKISGIKIHLK